jgi:hypothetical protein
LFAAWLDLRTTGTRLYGATSKDGGRSWSKNIEIYASPDGTICQCCHPSAAFLSDGSTLVMWRNALGGARDLYAARSSGGVAFDSAMKLGHGTWILNACPMDGGGLGATPDGKAVAAWRREGAIYLGELDGEERRIGDGKDVALAAHRDNVYAVWVSARGIELWRSKGESPELLSPGGAMPSILALEDGSALVAWEDAGGIAIRKVW